jgi:murein DD-endopeptidase MepM/ murein hydrolase activator NlpD
MIKRQIINNTIQGSMGRGGPMDMNTFHQKLAASAARITGGGGNRLAQAFPNLRSNSSPSSSSGKGFRTDRNNNPSAMTTAAASAMGLRPGVDYVTGDPFQGGDGRTYYTAKLLGDPVATTIKAINSGGFYTKSGAPRWSYVNALQGVQNWSNLNYNQKAQIVAQMYQHEGGSGSLIKNLPTGQTGLTALSNLGNLTSQYGEKTPDTNFHRGLDIANAQGTPIPKINPVPGKVSFVGQNGDYGNEIRIKNTDGTQETYGHLQVADVQPGQLVTGGTPLGQMGSSGNAWSPTGGDASHLHYELADTYNRLVNPIDYLNNLG